jgi:hypothetical protein
MIRGFGNAVITLVIAALLDKYCWGGHYGDTVLSMLRQFRQVLGL